MFFCPYSVIDVQLLQKIEKQREKKGIRALAGIEEDDDEFAVTERMNEDLVYMAGVKSHKWVKQQQLLYTVLFRLLSILLVTLA